MGELLARAQSTNGAVGQSSSLSETAVGDGGGDVVEPSTWMMEVQSAGDTGDTAFRFFLALVIMGKMTGLLQGELAWAGAASATIVSTTTAIEAAPAFTSVDRTCCCCGCCCWENCCCCCCPGCCCWPCCCRCSCCCSCGWCHCYCRTCCTCCC